MFEIDKSAFGEFLAKQRKAKGYTQKNLAEKIFVSDKAVSKWERGLSMPDISLLIPLSEILDISVTVLLEGRKLDHASEMDADQVEILVKKALSFSEDSPERKKERLKHHAFFFGCCTAAAVLEIFLIFLGLSVSAADPVSLCMPLLLFEILSLSLGVYAWFFIKERLPAYYDEHEIYTYHDRGFTLTLFRTGLNNSNWPYVVKSLRIWSAATIVFMPLPSVLPLLLFRNSMWFLVWQVLLLILYLAGLFLPMHLAARRYMSPTGQSPC